MFNLSRTAAVATLMLTIAACGAIQAQRIANPATVDADAMALRDFRARVGKYMELRKGLTAKISAPQQSADAAKIRAAQQVLADAIQAARKDSKAGDIFTPAVRTTFRRVMYPELTGAEGQDTKALIKDDAPTAVPLKINSHYPDKEPLSTVPPNILARLPQLPKELDYRIVKTHLLLRDVDANLILDFIPNAIR